MCVVVTFVLIVNSDIVLGRIAQFYLKRLCAYNSDHRNFFFLRAVATEKKSKPYLIDFQHRNSPILIGQSN